MAAFEFGTPSALRSHEEEEVQAAQSARATLDTRKLKQECIIALKVYDQCRQQDCLTEEEIGPARAAECKTICEEHYTEGAVIDPPSQAGAIETLSERNV